MSCLIQETLHAETERKNFGLVYKFLLRGVNVGWSQQQIFLVVGGEGKYYFTYIQPIIHQRWDYPGKKHLTFHKQKFEILLYTEEYPNFPNFSSSVGSY